MTNNLSTDSLTLSPFSKIYIAGHNGMVGSAIWRNLEAKGYNNLIGRSSRELDLRNQQAVADFFEKEKPEYIFLAAAKVGGILANNTYRAEFIYDNLQIQNNVIHQSFRHGVKKLLFLGSSCIYPKNCPQPMKEKYLLTGELEPTNEPYAIAKIAGIKLCENYNRQYGTNFISVMPTNLYGPNDNYNLETSHVLPALIRKFHLGKALENQDWDSIQADLNKNPINGINGDASQNDILNTLKTYGVLMNNSEPKIQNLTNVSLAIWGSGKPLREFLHVDDLADACIYIMEQNLSPDSCLPFPFINIGSGKEISIKDLAFLIKDIIGFQGKLEFDKTKPDGTSRKLLDTTIINQLGWSSTIDIESGIKMTYQNWTNNQ